MMKKILWISPYVPYDGVVHAGGKTHNYYIKYLHKSGQFDIHLISLAEKNQKDKIDLGRYGISYDVEVVNSNIFKNIYRMIYNLRSMFDSGHRLCQTILAYQYAALKKRIIKYAKSNIPDIVIMQWTGAAFLMPVVKKLFPKAKTVIIEEDVSFLGYERRYAEESNGLKKAHRKKLYENLKKQEIDLLRQSDYVVLNNEKDYKLLLDNGIHESQMIVIPPFYQDYSGVERNGRSNSILFYGVMSRQENHEAAMWFVSNVMPLLENVNVKFEVIGSNPREELKKKESDRVRVRGYVEDVGKYFADCLCMVVPLRLGAGIKVKVLEGLSAGVPVLTSRIGIEGIPAIDGEDIFCCDKPYEYDKMIRCLYDSEELRQKTSDSARLFMKKTYNIDGKLDELIKLINI